MIHRLGKEINNPESVYYWAYKVSLCIQKTQRARVCIHICMCVGEREHAIAQLN